MYFAAAMLAAGNGRAGTMPLPIDLRPDTLPDTLNGGAHPERFLFFAGTDLWRNGGTLYGGMLWSPHGIARDGLTFKLLYAGGVYRYRSGTALVLGAYDTVALMPGFHVSRGRLFATVYGGPDLQYHRTLPTDPGNRLNGGHIGLRVGADLWWQPLKHWMVMASLSASTASNSYGVRLATGWRLMERFWAGPEIEVSGDGLYRQVRFGVHITALRFWFGEWTLNAGYVRDSDHRDGLYGRLGFLIRR
ncbi:MAG: cellulose biosynthesis protein BcsS [Xanthobacteraceae bacterium]